MKVIDLLKIDLGNNKIYLKQKYMHLGFAADETLTQIIHQDKAKTSDIAKFKREARQMIVTMVSKIIEKSPLR